MLSSTGDALAYTARVAWSPVVGAAGYTIYVGRNANPYDAGVNVGARAAGADGRVRYDLAGLDMEATSHFVVVSYASNGVESVYSNEIQVAYAAVAAVVDSDGDGLEDAAEDRNLDGVVTAGETDRHNADTDGDGLSDGAEVAAGTDPLDRNDPGMVVPPTVTPTPPRTATPMPTATPTTRTAAPVPTATPASYSFPLEGWTAGRNLGTASVQANDPETDGPVLVSETDRGLKFSLAYPARATLAVPLALLSFTVRAADEFTVALTVQATNGRDYVLSYRAVDGVPTTFRRTATFPLGTAARGATFQTTIRDLAADLQTAFGVDFVAVDQAELGGALSLSELTLFAPGGVEVPTAAAELGLPLENWSKRGRGTLLENTYDSVLDAQTLSTVPANTDRPRIVAGFPEHGDTMAAAFRTLSLAVRTDGQFAIEVRVRLAQGVAILSYEPGLATLEAHGSHVTLPLELIPIEGSPYQLVTLDLATDVLRGLPGADLRGILSMRMSGQFQVGNIVLADPIE